MSVFHIIFLPIEKYMNVSNVSFRKNKQNNERIETSDTYSVYTINLHGKIQSYFAHATLDEASECMC